MAVGDITLTTPAEVASSSSVTLSRRTSCALSANRVAQLHSNTSGQGVLRVGQINSDNTITWGTASTIVSSNFPTAINNYSMCAIEETSVAIHYVNSNTNQSFILVVPVSGTTVGTPGTAVQTSVTTTNYTAAVPDIIQVGLNAVIISFTQITANGIDNYYSVRFANIVGTVPSLTTVKNITGVLANYDSGSSRLAVLTAAKCILLLNASAGSTTGLCTQYITYSESGISTISISLKQVYSNIASAFSIDSYYNKIVVSYVAGSNIDVVAATVDTSGVLTKGTPVTLSDGSIYSNVCSMSNNTFYVSYRGTNPYYFNFKRCTLSGTTITAGSTTTINEVTGGVSATMISEYKSFISYNIGDSTRNIKYIIANEEKPDWAIETYPATNAYPTDAKVTLWKTLAIDDSKFIQVYSTTVSKIAYAVIGTKDSNGNITYGTPVGWSTQLSFPTIVTASAVLLDSTHFVVGLYSATSAWCKYGTISGTSISFGSPYEFKNAASSKINLEKISDTSFLVSFISTTPISRIGTVSSGVISYGSEYAAPRTGTITNLVVRRLTSSSFVFTYKDAGLAATQRIMLANISDGVVSYEGATNILADYNTLDNTDILRLSDSSFILGYRNTTSTQYLHVRKCTISGTTITLGTAYSASGTGTGYLTNLGYIDSTHILITYRDLTTNGNNYVIGTLNDYEITFGTTFYDYRVPITKNSSSLITFDNIKFLSTGVDYTNTQIAAKLLSINKPVYSASYNGTGTITLSSSFTYEMEEAGKEYTASGTITLSASFDKEVNREKSISGTINLSSSFAYEWQAAQLDVVEVANGDITLSSSFDYFKTDDYIYNGTGAITLSSSFDYFKTDGYEYGVTGAITLSSSFNKAFDVSRGISGSIEITGDFDYEEDNFYSYNGTGTVNLSSVFTKAFDITRGISGNITLSSNFVEIVVINILETANGLIEVSGAFDYSNRPMYVKTITGTIHITSSFNYYYYDKGPIVVHFDKIKQQTEIGEDYSFCWLTANKVLCLYLKGEVGATDLYGLYINIDSNKNITLSASVLIRTGVDIFRDDNNKIIKVKDDLVLFNIENSIYRLVINQATDTFGAIQGYAMTDLGDKTGATFVIYNKWSWDVFDNKSKVKVLYRCTNPDDLRSGTRVANGVINANNTITWTKQLDLWPIGTTTYTPSMVKVRDNAFMWEGQGGTGICIAESNNTCSRYVKTTGYDLELPAINIKDDLIIAYKSSNNTIVRYSISDTNYTAYSASYRYVDTHPKNKIQDGLFFSLLNMKGWTYLCQTQSSIQENYQYFPQLDNYDIISFYDSSIGLVFDKYGTSKDFIPISYTGSFDFQYNGYGKIKTSASFDYEWNRDYYFDLFGTIELDSNFIEIINYIEYISGTITLSSDNICQVEYIEEVAGQINLSSATTYGEENTYPYIANGDITLSSDFTNINNYSYLSNANGVITLSSIEDVYPELIREITGQITLSSDFIYEEDNFYSYSGTGSINLSSLFTTENNYIYLTDANGVITVISNTYYEANSFEYILLGTINLSSSPVIENNYNYLTDANGAITLSSMQSTQMDYDRLVDGVITTSSIQSTQMDYDRLAEGVIILSGDIIPVQEDYVYNGSGVITLTSDFDYEEVNEYPYIGTGTILITGYFPEEVTTYKYHIEGEIQISSNTTYTWLADSKEVIRVESLISKTMRVESLQCTKILVRGLVNKKNKLNARL